MTAQENLTIVDLLTTGADRFAERPALVVDDNRQSYDELLSSAVEVGRGLVQRGVQPGERVGILMHNSLDLLHVLFGCSLARAVAVPMNNRLSPRELAFIMNDAGIAALVVGDHARDAVDLAARASDALPGLDRTEAGEPGRIDGVPSLRHALLIGSRDVDGFETVSSWCDPGQAPTRETLLASAREVGPEDPYMMLYTSGTTANPKGCVLPFRSIIKTGVAVARYNFVMTSQDRLWNPLPMFHVSAQAPLTGVLDAGGCYISTQHFDPATALQQIESEAATILFPAYPAIMQPLVAEPEKSAPALATVRAVLNVGPPDLLERFQRSLPAGATQVSCYGSTESGGIAVMGRISDPLADRLTCGKPLEGIELEIRDLLTQAPSRTGEKGAIWLRGYSLFQEYWGDPAKTSEVHDDDGWFNTGDLGAVDEDGNLSFLGRTKDMLKVGGENVAAVEIESFLVTHPDVTLAAVVGRHDPRLDEVPVAFVELTPGATVTPTELIDFCKAGLAKFKVPRAIIPVTEWPMSTTKIQKFRLKELLDQPGTHPDA